MLAQEVTKRKGSRGPRKDDRMANDDGDARAKNDRIQIRRPDRRDDLLFRSTVDRLFRLFRLSTRRVRFDENRVVVSLAARRERMDQRRIVGRRRRIHAVAGVALLHSSRKSTSQKIN